MDRDDTTTQLITELGGVARAVADVLGPDLHQIIEARLDHRCAVLAAELASDDDRLAAEAALTVMTCRWPDGSAPPPEWWNTPLGVAVARAGGDTTTESLTQTVAAAMLGVTRSTVATMLHRADAGRGGSGGLRRHPDGGVDRDSVMTRLARPRPR